MMFGRKNQGSMKRSHEFRDGDCFHKPSLHIIEATKKKVVAEACHNISLTHQSNLRTNFFQPRGNSAAIKSSSNLSTSTEDSLEEARANMNLFARFSLQLQQRTGGGKRGPQEFSNASNFTSIGVRMREMSILKYLMVVWASKWHQMGPIVCMTATSTLWHLVIILHGMEDLPLIEATSSSKWRFLIG